MKFNSVKRGNFSGLAGHVNRTMDQAFEAGRSTSVDHTNIAKESIKGRSLERRAAMKAEGKVARAGLEAVSKTKQYGMKADTIKQEGERKGKKARMAGVLGGLGALAGGFVIKKGREEDAKAADERDLKFEEMIKSTEQAYKTALEGNKPGERPKPPTYVKPDLLPYPDGSDGSSGSSSTDSSGGNSGESQSIGEIPSTLTGNHKIVADAIAGPESGQWGYEAFNQGGEKGGTAIPAGFKSGSYKDHFGSSLTSKTIGEILELQRDPGKGVMSDSEWVKSGKLHAVGRYQFIGNTLKDEVTRMGLDHNTKFTPAVQDKIFFSHLKRVGNISPWVGPMTKYKPEKRDYLNGLIPTL